MLFKTLTVLPFLTALLWSQQFSLAQTSQENFLNFPSTQEAGLPIYIDESTALAWENREALPRFRSPLKAQRYCASLKTGSFSWFLPTLQQLKSLSLQSPIVFGHTKEYRASDGPVWDNRLAYAYDAKKNRAKLLPKNSKRLYYVRCVASLEE